jgi:peptidoglycan hydrolase CwlO-like protein
MTYQELVPWLISLTMLIFAILTFSKSIVRDRKKDAQEDDATLNSIKEGLLKANMKLDQVCATTNETRSDIKSLNNDVTALDRRVTIIERDLKTAYGIIDELKVHD